MYCWILLINMPWVKCLLFLCIFPCSTLSLFCYQKTCFWLITYVKVRQIRVLKILTLRVCLMPRFPSVFSPWGIVVIKSWAVHVLGVRILTVSFVTALSRLGVSPRVGIGIDPVWVGINIWDFFEDQEFGVLLNISNNLNFLFQVFSLLLTACKRIMRCIS